jgi:type I restriction enzyme M protein
VIYLDDAARFGYLLDRPEGADLGRAVNEAMRLVEEHKPDLSGVLPRAYTALPTTTIASLLRHINSYTKDLEGDAFGLVYEYFLGQFAATEGQKGGEFFTPSSVVRLIVEIIEPFHGRIFDPACRSGGMFVHSARFVERHRRSPNDELSIFGQEKTGETVRLARMNMTVHGLTGDIREGNSYYEDPHDSRGRFDFVMANPPFNVDRIDKAKLVDDDRFPDLPKADNGNHLDPALRDRAERNRPRGIRDGQLVLGRAPQRGRDPGQAHRRPDGRRHGRRRPQFLPHRHVARDAVVPGSRQAPNRSRRSGPVHRRPQALSPSGSSSSRLQGGAAGVPGEHRAPVPRRGAGVRGGFGGALRRQLSGGEYRDLVGLCKVATVAEIAAQGWSLNPGRYVGTEVVELEDEVFEERLAAAQVELRELGARAAELEAAVDHVLTQLLERRP